MKAVLFEGDAYEQLADWALRDKETFKKIDQLLRDIRRDSFQGLGKPEPLKHRFKGYWSRRISLEHRLIYRVESNVIFVASLKGHYE